jgi:hypothetical protein
MSGQLQTLAFLLLLLLLLLFILRLLLLLLLTLQLYICVGPLHQIIPDFGSNSNPNSGISNTRPAVSLLRPSHSLCSQLHNVAPLSFEQFSSLLSDLQKGLLCLDGNACNIPEDRKPQIRRGESLKSHTRSNHKGEFNSNDNIYRRSCGRACRPVFR